MLEFCPVQIHSHSFSHTLRGSRLWVGQHEVHTLSPVGSCQGPTAFKEFWSIHWPVFLQEYHLICLPGSVNRLTHTLQNTLCWNSMVKVRPHTWLFSWSLSQLWSTRWMVLMSETLWHGAGTWLRAIHIFSCLTGTWVPLTPTESSKGLRAQKPPLPPRSRSHPRTHPCAITDHTAQQHCLQASPPRPPLSPPRPPLRTLDSRTGVFFLSEPHFPPQEPQHQAHRASLLCVCRNLYFVHCGLINFTE